MPLRIILGLPRENQIRGRHARLLAKASVLSLLVGVVITATPIAAFAFGPGDAAWDNYYAAPGDTSTWSAFCTSGGSSLSQSVEATSAENILGVPACNPEGSTTINLGGGSSTPGFQCVELSDRFLYVKFGLDTVNGDGKYVAERYANKYGPAVVPGDGSVHEAPPVGAVISFAESTDPSFSNGTSGHVAIVYKSNVDSSGNGSIAILSQNAPVTATASVSGWKIGSPFNALDGNALSYSMWYYKGTVSGAGPTITNISPHIAPVGSLATITGTNFSSATQVSFNGVSGPVSAVVSNPTTTQITATVPKTAITGPVTLTTSSGSASSGFTVIPVDASWARMGISGNEELFCVDSAGSVWQSWFTPGGTSWSGWLPLGAPTGKKIVGQPRAWIDSVTGHEEVYARDSAGNYWQDFYSGGWSGWISVSTAPPTHPLISDPTVIKGVNNVDLFGIDSAGNLEQDFYSGGWSGWNSLPALPSGKLVGRPFAWMDPVTGNEEVYARDSMGNYWEDYFSPGGTNWSWAPLGAPSGKQLVGDPSVVWGLNNIDLYGIDSAGNLEQDFYSGGWSGWNSLLAPSGKKLVGAPSAWIDPATGNEEVFARDSTGNDWQLFYPPGGPWSSWSSSLGTSPTHPLISNPTVIKGVNNVDLYGIDSVGNVEEDFYQPGGTSWSGWFTLKLQPSITTASAATFVKAIPGTFTVRTSGYPAPSLTESGTLPSGVTLTDKGNGTATLAGTSAQSGKFALTITAANGITPNATQTFTLYVFNLIITTASLPAATHNVAYNATLSAMGGATPYTWALGSTSVLPAGLTLSATGAISGTPTTAGTYKFSVTVKSTKTTTIPSYSASKTLSITVK